MASTSTREVGAEPPVGERETTGPRSLTRLLALFDALSMTPDGMSLAELSTMLESPKSSLLNLLRPMVSEAYLIHDGMTYRLGPSIFRLASGVLEAWAMPRIVRPYMEQLALHTGESVLLSVTDPDRGLMTYVEIVQSPHPVRYQIEVGTVRPLYASTAGRVLLAFADADWRRDYLERVAIEVRTATPITPESLRRELAQIRKDGLAWSVDGYSVGLSSVAAPIRVAGECVACINVAGPTGRFRAGMQSLKDAVLEAAAKASEALARSEE